jgi:hypothetical protein
MLSCRPLDHLPQCFRTTSAVFPRMSATSWNVAPRPRRLVVQSMPAPVGMRVLHRRFAFGGNLRAHRCLSHQARRCPRHRRTRAGTSTWSDTSARLRIQRHPESCGSDPSRRDFAGIGLSLSATVRFAVPMLVSWLAGFSFRRCSSSSRINAVSRRSASWRLVVLRIDGPVCGDEAHRRETDTHTCSRDFAAAQPEPLAGSEVTTERIGFVFSFHVFTLPLSSAKSVERPLRTSPRINALRRARRDHA